ncbi:MAG TPA: 39S ribosomal protein L45 [Candidatus Paenalcaligenes intestinipullorum]|uniref:39S ribosomal protein L45 n=1 Tax=Candidatus Paenalcaligenes intestinipullorum TaxID=2838718 RepID=A0A9D2U8R6_9BURK|nr:39S ribosomal protein L45 [Candidatus Paenalcaligenes intestinipullorum]
MTHRPFTRFLAALMVVVSTAGLLTVSFDAEARRMGGGMSFGRQSSNVLKQRTPATPPAARANTPNRAAQANTPNAGRNAANQAGRRGGMMGMLGGIAAGLGLAWLFSQLGLSGALASMFTGLLMLALVGGAIMLVIGLIRRSRGGQGLSAATAGASAYRSSERTNAQEPVRFEPRPSPNFSDTAPAAPVSAPAVASAEPTDQSWYIPEDFDTVGFLEVAKERFVEVQALWDQGDSDALREYLTDDLLKELLPQIEEREGSNLTEVVLLNAELLGIERVAQGYLASVRYSGMLREDPTQEAFAFQEVWNLYKADQQGWLVAGIQQLDAEA